jgi:copper chaperone CopZ
VFLAHDILGRFRVRVPALKGGRHDAGEIEARLRQVPGVRTALVSPITGSVLVEYQSPATCMQAILRSGGLLETNTGKAWNAASANGHAKPSFGEYAASAVCERLVELAIKAAAAALI